MPLTKKKLREHMLRALPNKPLIIVSNREPYVHTIKDGKIQFFRPAGGAANALDSVARAGGGMWFAHGSGDADRKVTDRSGKVAVPPDNPEYTLRRIWLSKEEEEGYYYGFSNKAMWPLCHIAYSKPEFNEDEWRVYKKVNRKFADAVLAEIGDNDAFVWIQDYHLALLPKYLKQANPHLTIAHFWHIPWPNSEAFRVCPKNIELLEGLLSNDLIGFHIRYHCNNFRDTVDVALEARGDRERYAINYKGHETLIRAFPISVDFDDISANSDSDETVKMANHLKKKYQLDAKHIVFGIDRIDYSKGIPERLQAIDRFFEKYPEYIGQVLFCISGAPSRMKLKSYQTINQEIDDLVSKVNKKYSKGKWRPVAFIREQFSRKEVLGFYHMADVCIVSPLHDGMNLVAKEYVSAKNNLNGVLVLSRFTGVAREFKEALLINPYDTDHFARTLKHALSLSLKEKHRRMRKLRNIVKQYNIYDWANDIVTQLLTL